MSNHALRAPRITAQAPWKSANECRPDLRGHGPGQGETNLRWNGKGYGTLEALVAALPIKVEIMDYNEHAIGAGTNAKAAA